MATNRCVLLFDWQRPNDQLTLIRHYFEAAQAMSPTAVGNGTQP